MGTLSAISRWAVGITVDTSSGCHNPPPTVQRGFKAPASDLTLPDKPFDYSVRAKLFRGEDAAD